MANYAKNGNGLMGYWRNSLRLPSLPDPLTLEEEIAIAESREMAKRALECEVYSSIAGASYCTDLLDWVVNLG